MSLKRLTADERAIYLLGEAVIRQLRGAPRDPATQREIEMFSRWVEHWLTADELFHVVTNTGFLFGEYEHEMLMGPGQGAFDFPPKGGLSDDEMPF